MERHHLGPTASGSRTLLFMLIQTRTTMMKTWLLLQRVCLSRSSSPSKAYPQCRRLRSLLQRFQFLQEDFHQWAPPCTALATASHVHGFGSLRAAGGDLNVGIAICVLWANSDEGRRR